MRKTIALILTALLAGSLLALPGHAGAKKKKRIEDNVSLTALPFPNLSDVTGTSPGCTAGEEGVHKVTTSLHVPGSGKLKVDLTGFTGDWDLYVMDAMDRVLKASTGDQIQGAPAKEALGLKFKKMTDVAIVACNWAGSPQAELHYKLLYTPAKKHSH